MTGIKRLRRVNRRADSTRLLALRSMHVPMEWTESGALLLALFLSAAGFGLILTHLSGRR